MQNITLYLHPISAKILRCKYGDTEGNISILLRHPISSALLLDWDKGSTYTPVAKDKYTEPITISVSDKIYHHVKNHRYIAAIEIYRRHRSELMYYVLGYISNQSREVTHAISQFYNIYGIDDDDMDRAHVYRSWTRWRQRNDKGVQKSKNNIVVKDGAPSNISVIKRLHPSEADIVMGMYVRDHLDVFVVKHSSNDRGRLSRILLAKMQIYVGYKYCGIKPSVLCKMYDRSLAMVYAHIKSWPDILSYSGTSEEFENSFTNITI